MFNGIEGIFEEGLRMVYSPATFRCFFCSTKKKARKVFASSALMVEALAVPDGGCIAMG